MSTRSQIDRCHRPGGRHTGNSAGVRSERQGSASLAGGAGGAGKGGAGGGAAECAWRVVGAVGPSRSG